MDMPDVGVAISSGAVGAISAALVSWWKAKATQPRRIEPSPLPTEQVGPYVTCGECKQHRAAIGKRIDTIEATSHAILTKLDEIDTRAEKRSVDLHRRLDPIVEKVAANAAKVEVFEAAIKNATIGGRK